jgi:hypothetical protein
MKTLLKHLPAREDLVVEVVTRFLTGDRYRVRLEVPNMGQSADIVATKGRWVTMIEAKTKDWGRAFVQCRAHELVADFVCVALLARAPSSALIYKLSETGYGLILVSPVDGRCSWYARPVRNREVWKPQRRRLSFALKAVSYAE